MDRMGNLQFTVHDNGVYWACFPELQQAGLRHGVSTRIGGDSAGVLATLNLSLNVNDRPEIVSENRRRFCEALGVDHRRVICSGQVHGDHVEIVSEAQAGQRIAETDGLVTRTPGLPLLLFFADCVPLLLFDPVRKVVGLSHAGWKGTCLGIGPRTLDLMCRAFGTDPADCLVGIGPSIGREEYEVDEPVMDAIRGRWTDPELFSRPGRPGHWQLDLWEWNRRQLATAGVPGDRIAVAGISTAGKPDLFFSHRASGGHTGRFGVLTAL